MSYLRKFIPVKIVVIALLLSPTALQSETQPLKQPLLAGKTIIAKGIVTVANTMGKLRRRSPIYVGNLIQTGNYSKTQLRMTDGAMIALKHNSQLKIVDYEYNATAQSVIVDMELIQGGMRTVKGKANPQNELYTLKTPIGTISGNKGHFEVEIVGDTVYLNVYDGAIDVAVNVGGVTRTLSLGPGHDNQFATISTSGKVVGLATAVVIFNP